METKKVIRFSFLPTKVDNKWIWLKKYVATYEYKFTSWKNMKLVVYYCNIKQKKLVLVINGF